MFVKLMLLSTGIVAISLLGLSISILIKKGGRFPSSSIGKNREMRSRGITCVKHDELKCFTEMKEGDSCSCSRIDL